MIHQSVNDFYTRFLLKIVALPQEVEFLLDISATFFNDFSPDVRYLLIPEGVQVPQRLPKKNHQGNQRLLLVRNAAVEADKKIITIKSAVQSSGGSLHHKTFVSMPGGSPLIKMAGLISSFKYEEKISVAAETMEEYSLDSEEEAYENLG